MPIALTASEIEAAKGRGDIAFVIKFDKISVAVLLQCGFRREPNLGVKWLPQRICRATGGQVHCPFHSVGVGSKANSPNLARLDGLELGLPHGLKDFILGCL